mmetsp:Transcript_19440/g.51680  ORF Transcript_19440/g.51680 Transcript_19440/m.51680 type:complete len:236 (+) Transcript_19440:1045-1752(+)
MPKNVFNVRLVPGLDLFRITLKNPIDSTQDLLKVPGIDSKSTDNRAGATGELAQNQLPLPFRGAQDVFVGDQIESVADGREHQRVRDPVDSNSLVEGNVPDDQMHGLVRVCPKHGVYPRRNHDDFIGNRMLSLGALRHCDLNQCDLAAIRRVVCENRLKGCQLERNSLHVVDIVDGTQNKLALCVDMQVFQCLGNTRMPEPLREARRINPNMTHADHDMSPCVLNAKNTTPCFVL